MLVFQSAKGSNPKKIQRVQIKTQSLVGTHQKNENYDIINKGDVSSGYVKFAHKNVRGYDYFNVSLPVYQIKDTNHLHIDVYVVRQDCGFLGIPESLFSEDVFGFYGFFNNASTCTATTQSTTQWWLGEEL